MSIVGTVVGDAKDLLGKLAGNKTAINVAEQTAILIGGDRAATAIKVGEAVVGAINDIGGVKVVTDTGGNLVEPPVAGSVEATLAQRGSRYGDFTDHARICQDIKRVMWATAGWEKLNDVQRQAMEVMADKFARILSGDPNYDDNWHDIGGYAKLVEDRLPCNQVPSQEIPQ